jgi:hypothetical protein
MAWLKKSSEEQLQADADKYYNEILAYTDSGSRWNVIIK